VLQVEHLLACRVVGPRAARNVEEIDRDDHFGRFRPINCFTYLHELAAVSVHKWQMF
jgi:hypothetical protein